MGFDAACRGIFGSGLDALEAEFWEEARRLAATPRP